MNSLKRFLAAIMVSVAIAAPVMAEDQLPAERQGGDMAFWDLILARPIGLLGVIGGSVVFVVALPFTIPSDSVDAAATELVKKPIDYTFKRPLGGTFPLPPITWRGTIERPAAAAAAVFRKLRRFMAGLGLGRAKAGGKARREERGHCGPARR